MIPAPPRTAREVLADHETEASFQQWVTDLCDVLHLTWHHETDSRRSKSGFPDLVIAGPGGLVFAELKKQNGTVSPAQRSWLAALQGAGAEAHVWRPRDRPDIEHILRRLARRRTP